MIMAQSTMFLQFLLRRDDVIRLKCLYYTSSKTEINIIFLRPHETQAEINVKYPGL